MESRLFTFAGGGRGPWRVVDFRTIVGDPIPPVDRLAILTEPKPEGVMAMWQLRGITSNGRYTTRPEKAQLVAAQAPLGRPEATCGALIPIRKSAAWWNLTQDERREIFEETSRHTTIGLRYLPAIARRLHHCRDLSENEPFDFLTWFEYAPDHAGAFEELVAALRATPEWDYVDREVDIRVVRAEVD